MPTKSEVYDKAIRLHEQGDLDGAVATLESLLADEPDYALAHAALCVFSAQQEQFDKAVAHGQRVCELEPDDPFSFVAMSLICQKAGRLPEAERALMQARQAELAAHRRSQD
ncbi:MAG: tetratricopeptide repeat protein [Pirellulales bacterium]|nr:tetratricopeptide repeat protein [Pirellulales bacterium]